MKSGYSGALKPNRLGLSCRANKGSDAGTGDIGVLTTHEIAPRFSLDDAGRRKTMQAKQLRQLLSLGRFRCFWQRGAGH